MSDYKSLKVAELKTLLQDRSLPVSGNKAELVARLTEDDDAKAAPNDSSAAADGRSVQDKAASPAPAPTDDVPAPAANTAAAPGPNEDAAAVRVGAPTTFNAGLAPTELDVELEKRRRRAEKFGISASSDAIKALERTKRFGGNSPATTNIVNSLDAELPSRARGNKREAPDEKQPEKRARRTDTKTVKTDVDPAEAAKREARLKKFATTT